MVLYLIPGLGTDERLFQGFTIPGITCIPLPLLQPTRRERLSEYARRMASNLPRQGPFALLGVSFGGIVATEMARIAEPARLVVVSSITGRQQLPWYIRLAGQAGLHRFVRARRLRRLPRLLRFILGTMSDSEFKILLEMIGSFNDETIDWAIGEVVHWRNSEPFPDTVQIHGANDRIFPSLFIRNAHILPGGTHLIILQKRNIIENIVRHTLTSRGVTN